MKKSTVKKIIAGLSSLCVMAQALPVMISAADTEVVYGDANTDGDVSIADAVLIMQAMVNADEYKLSAQGINNADVCNRGDGITSADALSIQKKVANLITELPESVQNTPATDGTKIHLNGGSVTVEGDYAEVSGTTVTISHSGSYYIDGTLDDGQINVNIPDEVADPETVKIFLSGVNITGKSAPAILVTNAENTSINIVDGTENFISDGDTAYSGDNLGSAVIEAKDDITVKGGELGTGILSITANTQDGIVSNNDIKFTGGITNITTLNATDKTDAVKGKTSVTVKDGTLNIDAEGDGLKSSKGSVAVVGGLINIKAGNDAVQAETTIDISGGTLIAGGDRGLTSLTGTNITGGTVIATATDSQTDASLISTTQGTMLLNCIASGETDGCWKKANGITAGDIKAYKWQKKYAYVLLSDASITADGSYKLTNTSTSASVTHDNSADFKMTGIVTVFDNVNPAGTSGGGTVTPPDTNSYTVTLSANSIETNAPEDVATVNNNVLTIIKPAVLSVSGENNGGQIVVDVDKTAYPDGVVELDLVNASISNDTVAPVYVASIGDEVQIVAKNGTVNTISDGTSHTDTYTDSDGNVNQVNAAIFARDDLKIKGSGSLTVNGNTADGIVSKNDLKIYNGNITVNAVDDAVRGKDSVTVGNATDTDFSNLNLTLRTQSGDGIKSTATDTDTTKQYGIVTINGGTVDIDAYSDGIQGEQDVVINGGDINIHTYEGSGFTGSGNSSSGGNQWGGGFGGGMQDGNSNKTDISAKGIKAVGLYDTAGTIWQSGGNITVNGGKIIVDSSDDSLHCGGNMNINGGIFRLATADDAMHSDHDLTLGNNGGTYSDFEVYVTKCYEGMEGQNIYQYSGTVAVKADDDGYNAAGGADGSGSGNNMGWNQGGRPGMGSAGNNTLNIAGGIAIVQSANGDHDAFDSNGNISITGGIVIANGQECLDCDGTKNTSGGTVAEISSQSSGSVTEGTQFTIADESDNIVVSFTAMRNMGSPSLSNSNLKCYTGGTISGGTDLITSDDSMTVYADGTISGGTVLSTSSGGGNWGGRW